ncbi:MAG TPA: UMP kinase [Chitinispirillaceae bacterium]|nr:UMP kinase [Chitinispirillaceae bacterium]
MKPLYKRILLKLSGEALAGSRGFGIDPGITAQIADEIVEVHNAGVQIGIVIGGGNFLRGATAEGIPRVPADTMGMLATVINSLGLKEYLEKRGCAARVLTAVNLQGVGELFSSEKAVSYLNNNHVVIIGGGTGNPYFTTDTAAALRCAEIGAEVILKATKVDGIYDSDPMKNPGAIRFEQISHKEALSRDLKVMDSTAFSFCMENSIPIIIFKLMEKGNLCRCIEGRAAGSIVKTGG